MITKAIIPAAGWGTRRLPITKSIEKCMLPVGNRPIIDYVVQDCILAGITDIYFVVGEQSTQLHDYYRPNIELNDYLARNSKTNMLPLIKEPSVNFHYIIQPSYGKYGTAIPVSLVFQEIAAGESVVVLMGDDFIYNRDESSEVAHLISAISEGGNAILGVQMPQEELNKYGVLAFDERSSFISIAEKPSIEEAPSNLINVSKYVFNYETLRIIYDYSLTEKTDEYYITDPINTAIAQGQSFTVVPARGIYLDSGTLDGWLHANNVVVADIHG